MTVYYNEWDEAKAAWLEQLQKDGRIAQGVTDKSDIKDVQPKTLTEYERVHFFAGIGGWEYACELAGWEGPIWTASCPCQPFSAAGRRGGLNDERHLFPAVHWLIEQCRPPIVVGEQVASKDGLAWLDTVFARLEATGYACAAVDLSAASVGAPHIRQRLYWVAYAGIKGPQGARNGGAVANRGGDGGGLAYSEPSGRSWEPRRGAGRKPSDCGMGVWEGPEWVLCIDPRDGRETWRPVEPGLMPLAHGVPARMVRIGGYGDAIVPQVAAAFLQSVQESLMEVAA